MTGDPLHRIRRRARTPDRTRALARINIEAGFASESRLAQELGVSRMTARAALVRLERDGLVSCA
ncbi:GntR family transcriptional regulator [Nonomuraea aurantiaca]|uniref:GntR family transcriptional regulator n=1 Tax=Nonomuraea aurantiaca TaxID=2878562 RepID=UPI003558BF77